MTSETMRRNRVPLSVLVVALSSCVVEPKLLNSERIAAKFGSYGIEVLSYHDGIRRASLFSTHGGQRVTRTYAVVRFDNVDQSVIGAEHARILAGASIGATFKANGWQVFKETLHIGRLDPAVTQQMLYELMTLTSTPPLAMHVYRLLLRKDAQTIEYATLIEVHHPQYLTEKALMKLYLVEEPRTLTSAELDEIQALLAAPL